MVGERSQGQWYTFRIRGLFEVRLALPFNHVRRQHVRRGVYGRQEVDSW